MKQNDITDFINLYASFMRVKENVEQIDVQIVEDVSEATKGDGEAWSSLLLSEVSAYG